MPIRNRIEGNVRKIFHDSTVIRSKSLTISIAFDSVDIMFWVFVVIVISDALFASIVNGSL